MTTSADIVLPPEGTLTSHQIDGICIMRKTLLGSPSYDEVWGTLSLTSDAINLDVPTILLWQDEGQKQRNVLFYCIDEGEEAVAMEICQILLDAKDKETLQDLVDATCYIHGEATSFRELAESKGFERILTMLERVGCLSSIST
ncbi:hypothetical protein QR685DRAFT_571139 [Neurospora intermedia]|uniref:Uncharacterized protein n=1 Tax=Neurospora intermedia TaxID=5142 RepID=A0ABR3DIQ8_NEUIN